MKLSKPIVLNRPDLLRCYVLLYQVERRQLLELVELVWRKSQAVGIDPVVDLALRKSWRLDRQDDFAQVALPGVFDELPEVTQEHHQIHLLHCVVDSTLRGITDRRRGPDSSAPWIEIVAATLLSAVDWVVTSLPWKFALAMSSTAIVSGSDLSFSPRWSMASADSLPQPVNHHGQGQTTGKRYQVNLTGAHPLNAPPWAQGVPGNKLI